MEIGDRATQDAKVEVIGRVESGTETESNAWSNYRRAETYPRCPSIND